jgi:hypothetical protein
VAADAGTGGEPVPKAVFLDGDGKNVDELLQADRPKGSSKTSAVKIAILDMLEKADDLGEDIESDKLTQDAMEATGASFSTVRNAKTALKEEGLIRFVPSKDEGTGKVKQWRLKRTGLKRPAEYSTVLQG